MSFVTSLFIQVFDTILPVPEPLLFRLLLLTAAILLTGIGAAMTVAMGSVLIRRTGWRKSSAGSAEKRSDSEKNLFDLISLAISAAIGLIFRRQLIGIGVGTILAMIFTGRVVALTQKPLNRLNEPAEYRKNADLFSRTKESFSCRSVTDFAFLRCGLSSTACQQLRQILDGNVHPH